MSQSPNPRNPRSVTPTPLRDWLASRPARTRIAATALFSALIACGGQAAVLLPLSNVPASHLLLFTLAAGALLGSRLGAVSASGYLLASSLMPGLWPPGSGPTPLTGPLAGFLWSLPGVAFASGRIVERFRMETWPHFAIGAAAGVGIYDALGTLGVMASLGCGPSEAFMRAAGVFLGQQAAHAAIVVMTATTFSAAIHARQQK